MPLNRQISKSGFATNRFYQTRQRDWTRSPFVFASKGAEAGIEIASKYVYDNDLVRRLALLLISKGEIGLIEPGTAIASQLNAGTWGINYPQFDLIGDTVPPQPLDASFVIPPGIPEIDLLIPISVGSDGVVLSGTSIRISIAQNNVTTELIRLWSSDTDRRTESATVNLQLPNDDGYVITIEANPAGVVDGYQVDQAQNNNIVVNGITVNYTGNNAITNFDYADVAEALAEQEAYLSLKTDVPTTELEGYSSALVYTSTCCNDDPERILVREGITGRNWQATGVATGTDFSQTGLAGQGILNTDSEAVGVVNADGTASIQIQSGDRWATFTTEILRYLPDVAVHLWTDLEKHPATLDWEELIRSREYCVNGDYTVDIQVNGGEAFSYLMNLLAPCSLLETEQSDGRWGLSFRRNNVRFVASSANSSDFKTGWEDFTQLAETVVCPYKNNDKVVTSGTGLRPAHTLNGRSIFDDAQAQAAADYYLNTRQFRRFVEFDVNISGSILNPGDAIVAFDLSFGVAPQNDGLTQTIDTPVGTAQSFVPRNQPVLLANRITQDAFTNRITDNTIDFTQFGIEAGDMVVIEQNSLIITAVTANELTLDNIRAIAPNTPEYRIIDLTLPASTLYLQSRTTGAVFSTTDVTVAQDGLVAKYTVDNLGKIIERGDSFVLLTDPADVWNVFRVEPLKSEQYRVRAVR